MDQDTPPTTPLRDERLPTKSFQLQLRDGLSQDGARNRGGWITTPFIFGSALCDWLASFGIRVNLITYLMTQLNLPAAEAATTVTNFGGMSSFTPLLGAFIADAYLGRYKTILVASVFYTMGISLLVIDASVPSMRPSKCTLEQHPICQSASKKHIGYLYLAFVCIALASGGIGPNMAAFGADQYDQRDPTERKQLKNFFNWYYFSLVLSILTSTTLLVYVQDNVGWSWGFAIPGIAMVLSTLSFALGSRFYKHAPPLGSPLSRLAQVVVAATRKRHLPLPGDDNMLHGANEKPEDGDEIQLCHTEQFRFFDKAAIETAEDSDEKNPWQLCSVHQIEELKSILRMVPVWITGVVVFVAWAQQNTFMVQQARTMDRHMGHKFQIPAASVSVISSLTLLTWLPIYDRLVVPLARRITGHDRGISFLQRIGTGAFLASLAMVVAGFVESNRRHSQLSSNTPMSWKWLIPQFCLVGLSEAFISIGYLEFFYDQAPPGMRSIATAIATAIIGASNYLSTFIVSVVQRSTGNPGWLANNINQGRLDYFYWTLAGILGANFCLFLFVASWYQYTKMDYNNPPQGSEGPEKA